MKLDLSEGRALGGEYAQQDLAVRRRIERAAVRLPAARSSSNLRSRCTSRDIGVDGIDIGVATP